MREHRGYGRIVPADLCICTRLAHHVYNCPLFFSDNGAKKEAIQGVARGSGLYEAISKGGEIVDVVNARASPKMSNEMFSGYMTAPVLRCLSAPKRLDTIGDRSRSTKQR